LTHTAQHLLRVGSRITSIETTASPSRSSMPLTPRESRPTWRISSDREADAHPLGGADHHLVLGVDHGARRRASPSSMATPMMPVVRMLA
jgi:hypothetical protein